MGKAPSHSISSRIALVALGLLTLATVAGLVALWPSGDPDVQIATEIAEAEEAEVVATTASPCQNPAEQGCEQLTIELRSGVDEGQQGVIVLGQVGAPELGVGDRIRVTRNEGLSLPGDGSAEPSPSYSLTEVERSAPMLWLAAIFAALVIVLGRWRGARSLVGLAISLALVTFFIIPAILDERSPLLVALVGSLAVMLTTIALAHGVGIKSRAAALGTAASLVLTVALALLFTNLANLFGATSEEATLLQLDNPDLSLQGLVLAGMVIGALGVLDDVTVSQASTVMALRRADPTQRFAGLYRDAVSVGKDHVAATVNTLVLAYVGASLPILLVFAVGDVGFADAVNSEAVAEQVVATLVGSIGLIAAVPITTALAALLATGTPAEALPADPHPPHAH